MATSFKKKDYYQFCYDENEVVSSNDSSYDDGDYDGEDLNSLNSEEDDDNNSRLSEDEGSCENIVNNIIDPTHEIEQQLQIPTADGEQPYNSDIQQQQQHNNKTTIRSQSYNDHLGDFLSKEGLEKGDHHSSTVPERRSRSCCFETDPFDGLDMMADEDTEFCSRDSKRSSPTSESIELDGYVIEIDEVTNTININSSPPQSNLLLSNSTEFLDVPSTSSITDNYAYIGEDDLSSSGVSLDSRISSANSLTTEINRLRNINSPMYIKDTPYHKRYRISNGGLGGSEDRLSRKPAAKSMNSLISRSSTPDRIKSPLLDFLKGKGKISEAKSDFELTKKKKSMMKKFSSKDASLSKSMFRLKRSSSPFKQKNKSSKNMGKVLNQNTSDPELTLQQPSPFVKTIFQFIETDSDEMFPFGVLNNYENYVVPVFSSNHGKLFQDLGKNNSLSRRVSKNKNNLSLIKRTVYQDGHDPIFLSSCRRVCENSDFLISTVAFLDRVRKVQETPQKRTTVMVETNRRHTINCENDVTVKKTLQPEIQQDEISNRLGHNTIRRKFNLPLTIHERFSTFSDSGVFDDDIILSSSDCLIKAGIPPSRSRSFSNLSETTEKDKKSLGLTRRSKSLRNLAYSSFRRKDKKKSKNQEKNRRNSDLKIPTKNTPRVSADPKSQEEGASDTQESSVPSGKKNSDEFRSNDIRTDNTYKIHQSNKSSIKTTLLTPSKVCEENLKETPNNVAFNEQKRRENMKDIYVTKNVNNTDVHNKVTSSTRLSSPINSEYVEKQYKPIKFLTDKLRNKNKKINKITEVEYLTSHNDISMELKPPAATISGDNSQLVEDSSSPKSSGVINLRRQFEEVTNKKEDASSDRMADTSKEPKDSKRKSGIRRSLSWRVKKDKPIKDDSSAIESAGPTSPASPGSPTKEKTGKLSSLRSKFEPLSPSEKKKWSLLPLSPSNKRSHKNTSKELPKLMEVSNSIDCPSSPLSDSATDDSDHSSKSPARSEKFSFSKFSRSKSTNSTTNNSANSSGSITSGRKISNEMLQDIISGCIVIPSSPELTKATPPTIANDSRHHKLIVNNSSSDFYSGDSSLFDDNRLKLKATPDTISRITDRKSSNDSSNNVGDDGTIKRKTPKANVPSSDEGSIVVDVPLHLLPPQIAGHQSKSSPKSSPKNELRHLFSNKSSRRHSPPTTSPVVKPKKPSSSENLNFHKSFKEKDARHRSGSSTEEISIGNMPNEVNNNFILSKQQTLNHQEIRDQNAKDVTMTTPTSSPPAVKPKPTTNKLRSVAVVKPKTLPSNIAMVSPIMKSEMMSHAIYSPSTPNDTRITELAMSPFKTVKRRPANNALMKWKNLEKDDSSSKPTKTSARPIRRANTTGRIHRRHTDGSNTHGCTDTAENRQTSVGENDTTKNNIQKIYRRSVNKKIADKTEGIQRDLQDQNVDNKNIVNNSSKVSKTEENSTTPETITNEGRELFNSISQITGAIEELTAKKDIETPVKKEKLTYVDSAVKTKRKSLNLNSVDDEPKKTPPPTSSKPKKPINLNISENTTLAFTKSHPNNSSPEGQTPGPFTLRRKTLNTIPTKNTQNIKEDNSNAPEETNESPTNPKSTRGLTVNTVNIATTNKPSCNSIMENKPKTASSSNRDKRKENLGDLLDSTLEKNNQTFPRRGSRTRSRAPISNMFPVKSNDNTQTCNNNNNNNDDRMPKTTADGKPIGYATKIMCNTHTKSNKTSPYSNNNASTNNMRIGLDYDDNTTVLRSSDRNSQQVNHNNLDSYIERSFKVIEKSIRDSAHEMTVISTSNVYNGNHPATNGQYTEQLSTSKKTSITYTDTSLDPSINLFDGKPPSPHFRRTKLRDRLIKEIGSESENDTLFSKQTIEANEENCSEEKKDVENNSKYLEEKLDGKPNEAKFPEPIKRTERVKLRRTSDLLADVGSTDDTMKEFEQFLRKQERRAKKEIYRLSQEEPKMSSSASSLGNKQKIINSIINRSVSEGDFTLENYRKQQQIRRKQRLEFQQHHLSERRRSLGILPNKWASASNIFLCSTVDKPLQRKLSLPHDIHKQTVDYTDAPDSPKPSSSPETPSPTGRTGRRRLRYMKGEEGQSGSFDTGKDTFRSNELKRRSHSTGDSPDSDNLLGHLICDIEEEMSSSGDSDDLHNDAMFESHQFEKEMSDDNLNTTSLRREKRRRSTTLRRARSENLHGDASPRKMRTREKRLRNRNTTLEPSRNRTSESWNVVKKVELSLLLDQDTERKNAVKIESLEVKNANSYRDIEELAVQAFIDHLQSLDEQMLDIGKDDLICLQLGKIKVSLGSSLDLSSVHVEDGILPCQLCLKGKKDWSLATMAYDTLIPKSFLEKYVSLILTHRQVIFYGPSGTGKSYVARRVASIITHRMNENRIPTIVFKNITESQWKTLLRSISDDKKAEPYVVLLDGFAPSFIKSEKDLTEIINACETVNPQPYVICTVTQSPNYEIPTLWQNCFKWIWLPNHEEPVDGLLHRYLRRRHMQTGDKNQDNTQKAFRIAEWLASTWRHINDILEKYHSTECTIGPTMFYTCPTDIECVEEWFLDLWNYSITPYFIQTVKSGLKLFGQRYDWVDPLEKILKTYPWLSVENQRISKLRRIRPEDVGYQPNNPPSCPSSPTQYSETEKERLLDFLRQLELLMHDGGLGELPSFDEATRDPVESSI